MAILNPEQAQPNVSTASNTAFKKQLNKVYTWYTGGFIVFVVAYFARDLQFNFFGWPFSFWVAAQGALIVYVIIIWYYARHMNRLDQEYGVAEAEED